ncbi:MAG: M15 family metallopeptidase [Defluviitaleaceae bacterium]|nr:M15 family metallopeptidase [Defluviitaleaceae bacterium]
MYERGSVNRGRGSLGTAPRRRGSKRRVKRKNVKIRLAIFASLSVGLTFWIANALISSGEAIQGTELPTTGELYNSEILESTQIDGSDPNNEFILLGEHQEDYYEENEPHTYIYYNYYAGIRLVPDPYDTLVLVNRTNRLPNYFSPYDLRLIDVLDWYNVPAPQSSRILMRDTAATAAENMFRAAYEEAGLVLWARSGYRSFARQVTVHQNAVDRMGRTEAERVSAWPGHSEHQTGLALDVTSASVNGWLVEDFSRTPEGAWVGNNAHRFGYIVRYLPYREAETGFVYEPWHIRYVGIESATVIFENGLILEEYLYQR